MQINCYKCDSPLAAGDVNIQQAIAKCSTCQAVFRLDEAERQLNRVPVEMPTPFTISHVGSETLITYRWSPLEGVLLVGFSLAWNGIIWWILISGFREGMPWFILLLGTPFVVVGLGLIYWACAKLVNSTTFRATPSLLTVKHGPLPMLGNRSLDPACIDRISSHERSSDVKADSSTTYEVFVHMIDGSRIELISDLSQSDYALFLEQELDAALAMDDRTISGKTAR